MGHDGARRGLTPTLTAVTRARAAAVTVFGVVLVVLGLATPSAAGSEQVPPSTSTTIAAPPTTAAAATPASVVETTIPASTVPRAASGFVDVRKPEAETWELRQVLTILGLAIVALAALGYAYGRIRSVGPRHPGLVRSVE